MCEPGNTTLVRVKIAARLSCDGKEKWKECKIDSCIAPIVKALQDAGIDMLGSCCGHGQYQGHITLADGSGIVIQTKAEHWKFLKEL